MKIFFDAKQKKWGHRQAGKHFVWGKQGMKLEMRPFTPAIPFKVNAKSKQIGPLVGILTSSKKTSFAGNRNTFFRIHRSLQRAGGIAYVFTPEDAGDHHVKGYVFNDKERRWSKSVLPYPDVVYNRVPYRDKENTDAFRSLIGHLEKMKIPYFNNSFLDKWTLYHVLKNDPALERHLPATVEATEANLKELLDDRRTVYFKPKAGQKGEGMFAVADCEDGRFLLRGHKENAYFSSFEELCDRIQFAIGNPAYLLQPRVRLANHAGRPYDFRVMMQKIRKTWKVTGVGVRQAGKEAITTHVPRGGRLLSVDEVTPPVDLDEIYRLCKCAAERLDAAFHPLYELSFDIGRDERGHHWLFEANAKPMVFDEPAIESKRMRRLVATF
ncbi:MAG TPA: YheC/YheD family protein, partial [Bacillales bacterium]|nr:YheC/YheD family protein [Bacillales bacterium]